jgi:hypothetical protein
MGTETRFIFVSVLPTSAITLSANVSGNHAKKNRGDENKDSCVVGAAGLEPATTLGRPQFKPEEQLNE